jgi:hypothetical protein
VPGEVEVRGVLEAQESATWEWHGKPVFVRGWERDRLGSLVRAGSPVIRGHENVFKPLVLELAFEDER